MIIQLDSNFRDYINYPYSSDYVVTVNGTPPDNLHSRDVRSSYLTDDYIRYAFKWIGNSNDNPLSKIPNDSYQIKFIPLSGNQILVASFQDMELSNDYFVGLIFWDETSKLSANVIAFNFSLLTITLDRNIFQEFMCRVAPEDISSDILQIGVLVNPSLHAGKNLLLLGTTRFLSNIDSKLVLVKGLNSDLYITNVTKNWTTEILSIEGEFRNVIVKDIPSYDSNDFFIVTKRPATNQLVGFAPPFIDGLRRFRIVENNNPSFVGESFTYNDAILSVSKISKEGNILDVRIVYPGNLLSLQKTVFLSTSDNNNTLTIDVNLLGRGVNCDPNIYLRETIDIENKYLFACIDQEQNNIFYYVILGRVDNALYLELDDDDFELISKAYDYVSILYGYLIPYFTIFPNLVIPYHSLQNTICCQIRLVSLSLPNLPVCGFNLRLADFPYLLVSFSNSQGVSFEVTAQICSNVPASTKTNFVCPISNVKNPDLNFVSITTKQYAIFKFKPKDSIRFQILLPNGEILRYSRAGSNFTLLNLANFSSFNFESRKTKCIPLNLPLNKIIGDNKDFLSGQKLVFPYSLTNNINAVFDFQMLS